MDSGEWVEVKFQMFDTVNRIMVQKNYRDILPICLKLCQRMNHLFSPSDSESDVVRLGQSDGTVVVQPETEELLRCALEMGAATDGLFDITVADMVKTWDVKRRKDELPSQEMLDAARCGRGLDRIKVRVGTVTLPSHVSVDLGGIAKGYIADALIRCLREHGVPQAMINLGGNVAVLGSRSQDEPWRVGIRNPYGDREKYFAVIRCSDSSVVTSASNERYFEYQGKRYHHLIDPETGCPAESGLVSATVVCPSSTYADALSTACFVGGWDRAKVLLARFQDLGAEGVLLDRNGRMYITRGLVQQGAIQFCQMRSHPAQEDRLSNA